MTRYVVHVGDGKCGSSSIQASLHEARAELRAAGLLFETATPKNGHFSLATLLGRETRADAGKAADLSRRSLEMMRAALRPGDTVLLTAESFFNAEPTRLVEMLRRIDPRIDRLDIVAYVRAPHDMYLSLVQQTLKGDSRFTPPERYARDIHRILRGWQTAAGIDSLTVRNFDRAKLVGGDVVTDFENQLRRLTGRPEIRLPPATRNASLSAEQLVALQRNRARHLKVHDGRPHRESQTIIRYFEELTGLGFPGSRPVLTDRALASLARNNAAIVERTNAAFPDLGIGLPAVVPARGEPTPRGVEGGVERILARLDDGTLALVEALVASPRAGSAAAGRAMAALRRMAARQGIDHRRLETATRRFWQQMEAARSAAPARQPAAAEDAPHPMILRGRDDWLFLRADRNRVLDQITGAYPLAPDFERLWAELFEHRAELARRIGYRYFYGIAPNKECVYAEALPDGIALTEERPVQKVLAAARGRVAHRYHLDALREAARRADVFVRGDTHWNHRGALVAFNETMRTLGLPGMAAEEFVHEVREIAADLSGKMGRTCPADVLTVRAPRFRLVDNNRVDNIGQRRVYEHEDQSLPRCVFFRDSFTSHQLEMFASRFSRIVFLWQPNIDYGLLREEAPDIVISQQVERFLVECPDDRTGPAHRDHEARKLAMG